ncbi:hypothetical protein K1719_002615 [Acacia pycnantha]|nr:hypothetical protein K1719_002615 [Acacia pycnantha]
MGASASELKSSMKRTSSTITGVPAEDKRVKVLEAKVKEQEEKVKEQGEMLAEMRALIQSLLKEKGGTPGGDIAGDNDDHNAAV